MMGRAEMTTSTTRRNATQPTDARVAARRTVTYFISTVVAGSRVGVDKDATVRNLAYAVAVDGRVLPEYANAVRKTTTDGATPIRVTVNPGQSVSLYLNSDAVPGRRNHAVYAVTPTDKNVVVNIQEKLGKHNDTDTPTAAGGDAATARYRASLTGDIWMKITHKFTPASISGLLPQGTSAEIIAAVTSIYSGLATPTLTMRVPATGFSTTLTFAGNENANRHINNFSLTRDGLPRVHPACFAAILKATIDANVSNVTMNSNWRPCLGSIAHRCGLGADVSSFDGIGMNHSASANARVEQLRRAHAANPTPANQQALQRAEAENEPDKVKRFRRSLQQNPGVKQVLDPWQVDTNTRDSTPAAANVGQNALATQHNNHLHVTARDEFLIS